MCVYVCVQVEFFPFFTSESQLRSWGVSPVAGLWEKLIGLGLNQAYKDAPLFFMFGRVKDQSTVDLALAGIDAVYSGTAKVRSIWKVGVKSRVTGVCTPAWPVRQEARAALSACVWC